MAEEPDTEKLGCSEIWQTQEETDIDSFAL